MKVKRRLAYGFGFLIFNFYFLISPVFAGPFQVVSVRDHSGRVIAGRAVAGQVLVKFRAGVSTSTVASVHRGLNAREMAEISSIGWKQMELPPGMTIEQALDYYRSDPNVESVQPNHVYRPLVTPNDPMVGNQYALANIDAFGAWEFETGFSNNVVVAVIDTGVDGTHPDLNVGNKLYRGIASGFVVIDPGNSATMSIESSPTDSCGHGTEVAGIAAAATNNGQGIAGVSWGARILPVRVFTPSFCNTGTSDFSLSSATLYVVQTATTTQMRTVINMSLGECSTPGDPNGCGGCGATLTDAVNVALSNNVVVVASAGNLDSKENPNKQVECPAAIPGVIAVGATDTSNNVASFSATGSSLTVTAPGDGITSTQMGGGYTTTLKGTSFSSPQVAGLAALILSALPTASTTQVVNFIKNSADDFGAPGFDPQYGFGRINAYRALRLVKRGTLSDFAGEQQPIAFPNPFRVSSQGHVSFGIPQSLVGPNLVIKIYTLSGELVKTTGSPAWDGKNDSGEPVASGVYIYLVKSDKGLSRGRLALIR